MEIFIAILVLAVLCLGYYVYDYYLSYCDELTELDEFRVAYYLKSSLMDRYEKAFYDSLRKQLPENLTIFTKVRIEDFIGVRKSIEERSHFRGYIKSRHFDFLLCDNFMKPVLVIELDGSSHKNARTAEVDERKDNICEAVGLQLERVRVGTNYESESLRIRNLFFVEAGGFET